MLKIPEGDLDLLTVGETVVDFIATEETTSLDDAHVFRRYQGGSPANIALYVARLGGTAAVISKTGNDTFGEFLKASLEKAGVLTDYMVLDPEVHTTAIFISRTPGTADSAALREGDYHLSPAEITEEAIRRAKVVHASTFALSREPARSAVEKAFRLAHDHGKLISLDPNYNPPIWPNREEAQGVLQRLFRYATFTKPSLDDAARLFGPGDHPEHYVDRYHEMGARTVVLTMGNEGSLFSDGGSEKHYVPARIVEVADATGAGDAFWAGFLIALLDGKPPEHCVWFAREIAARKLTTVGPFSAPIDRRAIYETIAWPPA